MEEKKEEAINYALDSNRLENNYLTNKELEEVLNGIDKTDESFLKAVVDLVNKTGEDDNVKIKK